MYKNLQYNGKWEIMRTGLLLVFTALYISKGFKIVLHFCPPPAPTKLLSKGVNADISPQKTRSCSSSPLPMAWSLGLVSCGHLQTCPQAEPGQLGGLLASDEQVSPVYLPFPMSQVGMKRVPPPKAVVVRQRDPTRPNVLRLDGSQQGICGWGRRRAAPHPLTASLDRTAPPGVRLKRRKVGGGGPMPGIAHGRRRGPITSQMVG